MAAMQRPILNAVCHCGEHLIEYSGEDQYWTRSKSIIALFADVKIFKTAPCPGHGGDPSIKMSGGYHPRFYRQAA